jgi:hypothetical protein
MCVFDRQVVSFLPLHDHVTNLPRVSRAWFLFCSCAEVRAARTLVTLCLLTLSTLVTAYRVLFLPFSGPLALSSSTMNTTTLL